MKTHAAFNDYLMSIEGAPCYLAGRPHYTRNFSRDGFMAGILAADEKVLATQLEMSRLHQGKINNPYSGEEPGKIHHEYPGVNFRRPYSTTYNACDTTALYLIALEAYMHANAQQASQWVTQHRDSVEDALGYLQSHISEDIFWEYPPPPTEQFSLRVTYWKDSILQNIAYGEEPIYPVVFTLVQFQVARALLAASRLLQRDELAGQATRMFDIGIIKFVRKDAFGMAQDRRGLIEQPSSDELHALAYIPAQYASRLPLKDITKRASHLVTPAGFACTPQTIDRHLKDHYHSYVVWPVDQAFIQYGCRKFGLERIGDIAARCAGYIGEGQELLAVEPTIQPLGNKDQLFSVAASIYFSNDTVSLRHLRWL